VEMRCDDVADSIVTCDVETICQPLLECNNIAGNTNIECIYSVKYGVETSVTKGKSMSTRSSIMRSLGFDSEFTGVFASAKFSASKSWKEETGKSQAQADSTFFLKESTETVKMNVLPNSIGRLFQVVGYCGDFYARSVEILIDQRKGDLPKPIPTTGFEC